MEGYFLIYIYLLSKWRLNYKLKINGNKMWESVNRPIGTSATKESETNGQ